MASSSGVPGLRQSVKEYSIIVPKNYNKKYHVMRFNSTLNVEFDKWTQVKMERENNMREFRGNADEEQPKFGAGSEFGREAKEEARRKKLGIMPKKYKPEDQPWILKSSGSTVKKFKGIREGGVSENTAYYVFTHAANNIIQAFPLNEWYKFQPIQRYKTLSAEEAEQEFSNKKQHLNFFSLMLRKRLKGEEDSVLDGEEDGKAKGKKGGKSKELKISEMDEWMDTSEDDSENEDAEKSDEEDKADKKKKKQKGKKGSVKNGKKKKRDTDGEAFEDSDDGDGEGRELDYITDSSASEPENTELEGVDQEKALRKALNSDEEEDSDSDKEEKEEKEDEEKEKTDEKEEKSKEPTKSKKKSSKKDVKKDASKDAKKDDNSDFSSDSSTDEEVSKKKAAQKTKKGKVEKPEEKPKVEKEPDSPNSSRSASPTIEHHKRKMSDGAPAGGSGGAAKKSKMEPVVNYIPGASESGITEDTVRKYLMRKPMTTTELLQKFKSKKTGLSSEQLVNIMTQILKKINPVKQMLKGKMYLSIKS